MWNIVLFFCCYLSGLFFGVMFFTIIENSSKGFRQLVRKLCFKIPFFYRRILMWVMLVITAYIGYNLLPLSISMKGIVAGAVGGIFMYFKAGVTMGNVPDPYNKERKRKMKRLNERKSKKGNGKI